MVIPLIEALQCFAYANRYTYENNSISWLYMIMGNIFKAHFNYHLFDDLDDMMCGKLSI